MRSHGVFMIALGLWACTGGQVGPGGGNVDPNLTVSQVSIEPESPTTLTSLTAQATVNDERGREFTVRYAWFVDDQVVQQGPSSTLDASSFVRDQTVFVEVVASTGRNDSAPERSAPVQILNSPPAVASAALDPAQPTSAEPITCVASGITDPDGDDVTLDFRWIINGAPFELNSATLPPRTATRGQSVACEITPTDGTDRGEPVQSPQATVANGPPFIASVTIDPRPAFTTSVLTAIPSVSDPDGDPVTLTWQWTVDGVPAGTTPSLSPDRFTRDNVVQVTARAFDGELESAPRSSDPLTISNSPPTAPEVALTPAVVSAGESMTCSITRASVDPDGDGLSYLFDYFRNGDPYTGPTTTTTRPDDTVPGDQVREGDVWTCAAQSWDRTDTSPWSPESAPVRIGPAPVELPIRLGDLVNQGNFCGFLGRFNAGCTGAYGFSWEDEADDPPRSIEIIYNHGINCSTDLSPRAATLNGVSIGTAPVGDETSCFCGPDAATWERSLRIDAPESYRAGDSNTFLMASLSCEGFRAHPDWELDDGTPIAAKVVLRF